MILLLNDETARDWRIPSPPARYAGKVQVIFGTTEPIRVEIYIFVPAKPKPVKPDMKWSDIHRAHEPDWEELYVRWIVYGKVLTHEEYINLGS